MSFKKQLLTCLFLFSTLLTSKAHADEPFSFQTIIVSNQEVPGVPGALMESFFAPPLINNSGEILIRAFIDGPGVDGESDTVLLSGTKNALTLVQREGDQVPGFPDGVTFNSVDVVPFIDDFGDSTFASLVFGPGLDPSTGIFSESAGTLELVLLQGDSLPFIGAGVEAGYLDELRVGDQGHQLILAVLDGAGISHDESHAVLRNGPGGLELVLQQNDSVPGIPGAVFSTPFDGPMINAGGDIAVYTQISNGQHGIFSSMDGVVEPRALSFTEAPGVGFGVTHSIIMQSSFNDNGQVAYYSLLNGNGSDDRAVFVDTAGNTELVALEGELFPGGLGGQLYESFIGSPVLNGNGDVAYLASLKGALVADFNDLALFATVDGTPDLIVREGQPFPGELTTKIGFISDYSYNTNGNIAFESQLTGPTVDLSNDMALFMTVNGQRRVIIREGDMFDVDDDPLVEELREIADFNLFFDHGLQRGMPSGFNEAGQLAMILEFTDGTSGIFVVSLAIPGDVNGDGEVNLLDVAPFVDALSDGSYIQTADINCDGVVNLLDVAPFVALLTG